MLRLTPLLIYGGMLGCKACAGCGAPEFPDEPDEPVIADTEPPMDTAETALPEDTTPPPPCEVPETEPNDAMGDANALPLEQTGCGGFTTEGDGEWLLFPGEDAEWLRVAVRAAAIGSAADVAFSIMSLESYSVTVISPTAYSEDPWLLFPALGDEEYLLYLTERSGQHGDDHEWEIMASEDKAPVAWTVEEIEDNDLAELAQTVEAGEVILGTISRDEDYDWFHIPVPDSGDKISWSIMVEAYTSGSPLAARMTLYPADIVGADMDDVDWLASVFGDEDSYDRDPHIEIQSEEATDWYLVIKSPATGSNSGGSPFHWYSIAITNDLD